MCLVVQVILTTYIWKFLILELAIGDCVVQVTRYMYLIQNVGDHLENDSW